MKLFRILLFVLNISVFIVFMLNMLDIINLPASFDKYFYLFACLMLMILFLLPKK